jgi:hypothetical protein
LKTLDGRGRSGESWRQAELYWLFDPWFCWIKTKQSWDIKPESDEYPKQRRRKRMGDWGKRWKNAKLNFYRKRRNGGKGTERWLKDNGRADECHWSTPSRRANHWPPAAELSSPQLGHLTHNWYPTLLVQTHPQHQPPPQGQHLPHHPAIPMSP